MKNLIKILTIVCAFNFLTTIQASENKESFCSKIEDMLFAPRVESLIGIPSAVIGLGCFWWGNRLMNKASEKFDPSTNTVENNQDKEMKKGGYFWFAGFLASLPALSIIWQHLPESQL
jgi:hypothetical protein